MGPVFYSRKKHDDCISKICNQDDEEVLKAKKVCQAAMTEMAEMAEALQNLKNMLEVLQVVTAAVQLGTKLVSLAVLPRGP
jgi:hypothetical protein